MQRISILLFLCFTIYTYSQANHNYVPNEYIVQLDNNTSVESLLDAFSRFEGKQTGFKFVEELASRTNIWLVRYSNTTINQSTFLKYIQTHSSVILAQKNHYVKMRSTYPNDSLFYAQWHHLNSGQRGGIPNLDIDSDLAWDRTTGGNTILGDTIVVAIIDNGCEVTHPDLAPNIWYNYAEIPNNNIDDDNNGYVDDFRGWNTNAHNDEISLNGGGIRHGTEIAGLIGAKGNNGKGIVGVNWKVKLMIIRNNFNTTEANIITAYGYALNARRRYNQTRGRQGAFVVATNASWGIDDGHPSNSPIWCAFYDTLGTAGILNIGATTNNDVNIDIVGDLPTTCPSDFMIGVTGLDRFGSCYGGRSTTHIDLGVPAGSLTTTSANGGYHIFGGTSATAPLATAAIALAYAGACSSFIQYAKLRPAEAALDLRKALLSGGSTTGGLMGFTATGKRLNLNGMLQILPCPADSCFVPSRIISYLRTNSSLSFKWDSLLYKDSMVIRWKIQNSNSWNSTIISNTGNYTLKNLNPCTYYQVQFKNSCSSANNNWSSLILLLTNGCPNCENDSYCDMHARNSTKHWIQQFTIAQWAFPSGNNNGYISYDSTNIQLNKNVKIPIELKTGRHSPQQLRIWIDLDQNNDFGGADELIYSKTLNTIHLLRDTILIPLANTGHTRMRVAMRSSVAPELCEIYQNGEVEDYCITILPLSTVRTPNPKEPQLYPNPNSGHFMLKHIPENVKQVILYGVDGQTLWKKQINTNTNKLQVHIPFELPSGIYILALRGNKISTYHRLVIVP